MGTDMIETGIVSWKWNAKLMWNRALSQEIQQKKALATKISGEISSNNKERKNWTDT